MNTNKLRYIEKLIAKRNQDYFGGPFNLLIHSVLNTIDFVQLVNFFIGLPNNHLKKSIESNLDKRIPNCNAEINYQNLYNKLKNSNYKRRQRIRKLLNSLLPFLDKTYSLDFFNTFYNSKFKNDIKSALSTSSKVWNDRIENQIIEDYNQNQYHNLLKIYLENASSKKIICQFDNFWREELENYLKLKLVRIVGKDSIKNLYFLSEKDPNLFLYAASLSKKNVPDEVLKNCLTNMSKDQKPFGIINISKLGKWNLIEEYIKEYAH